MNAPGARGGLSAVPLFAGIDAPDLERVEHFMTPFAVDAGAQLFRQGDRSDRMHVIEHGLVEIRSELTAGTTRLLGSVGRSSLLGEVSLLGGGSRSATALAVEETNGWMLHHTGLESLRVDPAAGSIEIMARLTELVLRRLRERYEAIARELPDGGEEDPPPLSHGVALPDSQQLASSEYLATLLCFRAFHDRAQVAAMTREGVVVELPPGSWVLARGVVPEDALLVLRGALAVSIRRAGRARSVGLAGPGRLVGLAGALDGGASPVLAHAREHVIAVRLPADRLRAMLRRSDPVARLFSASLAGDIARAVRQAERPTAGQAVEVAATAQS
jgi:CRP-like cAMP-binding protein